jgi:lathosterol oxidase
MYIVYFFLWTFVLYWIHRAAHKISLIKIYHFDHHSFIIKNGMQGWKLNNLLLFNDTYKSTIDLYITEVIPTILFCLITGQWWIFIGYYIWAALFQEWIEHDPNIDILGFTSGKWHLIHHKFYNRNYGLFFPLWDIIFGTYKNVD